MASSGGIGGGASRGLSEGMALSHEAVHVGAAQISADGKVSVNGTQVDLATAAGAAALRGAVDAEGLATIKGLLQLKEVDTAEGPVLVPDDSYRRVDTAALRRQLGPTSTSGGDDLDAELGAWFESQGVADPFNANTTPPLEAKLLPDPRFGAAVGSLNEVVANNTPGNLAAFHSNMQALAGNSVNIHEILFLVFKHSIKETNEDKKYFLQKLQMYNDMGEELSKYLSELVDASRDLGARAAGAKYPEMVLTAQAVEIKKFDLSTTGPDGKLMTSSVERRPLDRAGLNDTIKEVESMQETVRNKRQMASTAFQNFDQKANQLYNLLSSVMKSMNEMRMGTVRNML